MLIGFVGDVHGRVFHMVAVLSEWQRRTGQQLDLIVQVGDLGAYPDAERMDQATQTYAALDASERDFGLLLRPDSHRAESLKQIRSEFLAPIYFVRGNHEDMEWLASLETDGTGSAQIDPFDFLRYVPDGTVLECQHLRVGFLGGEDHPRDTNGFDLDACESLKRREPRSIDILVTHDAAYGASTGYQGQVQGSERISALVAHLQPRFHVCGHYHQLIGPRREGDTKSLCLSSLVASSRWHPEATGLQPGCMAVLDTSHDTLSTLTEPWLSTFPTPFDFGHWHLTGLPASRHA